MTGTASELKFTLRHTVFTLRHTSDKSETRVLHRKAYAHGRRWKVIDKHRDHFRELRQHEEQVQAPATAARPRTEPAPSFAVASIPSAVIATIPEDISNEDLLYARSSAT